MSTHSRSNSPRCARWTAALALLLGAPALADEAERAAPPPAGQEFPGLVEAVRFAWEQDPWIEATRLELRETAPGELSVSGTAADLLACERACTLARAYEGVRGVQRRLRVQQDSLPAEELERALRAALAADYATRSLRLEVRVDGGEVTLKGDVPSAGARALVVELASRVRGVEALEDELSARPPEARGDAWIRDTVRAVYANQTTADLRGVIVEVRESRVTLSGTLRAPGDLFLARTLAEVEGTRAVDASRLRIHWVRSARPAAARRAWTSTSVPAGEERTPDLALAERVFQRLTQHPRLANQPEVMLTVRADRGVVRLGGKVPCLAARELCARLARETRGVQGVTNVIALAANGPKGEELERDVTAALYAVARIAHAGLSVEVSGGEVTLGGRLASEAVWRLAREVAARVPGVLQVGRAADSPGEHAPPPQRTPPAGD
ncbi:MAG: BON domain-containing protein [Planctomycetota bacterium]